MARSGATRPRDAATLVLTRGHGRRAEVLLGRRAPGDRFMPDVWVFPGGRVDPGDARVPAASELRAPVARELARTATPARARALAVAAVRETFEETGLALGVRQAGALRPDLARLDLVARAITPAWSPIRYHARFFRADAGDVAGALRGSGELLDLAWVPLAEAGRLDVIDATAFVLGEVAARIAGSDPGGVPLVHYRGGRPRVTRGPPPAPGETWTGPDTGPRRRASATVPSSGRHGRGE